MDNALKSLLNQMVEHGGSDLYLTTNAPPSIKVDGTLQTLNNQNYAPGDVSKIAQKIVSETQWQLFLQQPEINIALDDEKLGRFRLNIFQQRNEVGIVIRHIPADIPAIDTLNMPELCKDAVLAQRGLIIIVGATGSGKSTSIAAMIDHRNAHKSGHIITIEDPIEFVHQHKKSIITQREVGIDTHNYHDALVNALRQAPDAILLGEIRDRESMEHALMFAETGHLCLATLHANHTAHAIERILHLFPEDRHTQLLYDIAQNLNMIMAQRLVPVNSGGRALLAEVLVNTPLIQDLISKYDLDGVKEAIGKSEQYGMQSFDDGLFKLYQNQEIDLDNALNYADSANNLRLKIKLHHDGQGEANLDDSDTPRFHIADDSNNI